MEKKVPDKSICGKLKMLIISGIMVSFLTMLEKIRPTPISINKKKILSPTISIKVMNPCAKVNPMQKCPTVMSTKTFINWKNILLNPIPNKMFSLFTGVA